MLIWRGEFFSTTPAFSCECLQTVYFRYDHLMPWSSSTLAALHLKTHLRDKTQQRHKRVQHLQDTAAEEYEVFARLAHEADFAFVAGVTSSPAADKLTKIFGSLGTLAVFDSAAELQAQARLGGISIAQPRRASYLCQRGALGPYEGAVMSASQPDVWLAQAKPPHSTWLPALGAPLATTPG